jgi:hypothetical protein
MWPWPLGQLGTQLKALGNEICDTTTPPATPRQKTLATIRTFIGNVMTVATCAVFIALVVRYAWLAILPDRATGALVATSFIEQAKRRPLQWFALCMGMLVAFVFSVRYLRKATQLAKSYNAFALYGIIVLGGKLWDWVSLLGAESKCELGKGIKEVLLGLFK